MSEDKKTSIFSKIVDAANLALEDTIAKSRASLASKGSLSEEDYFYAKTLTEDPTTSVHAQGWRERTSRINASHLKQMSYQDSVITSVILTRQNQASLHSKLVGNKNLPGWMIEVKDVRDKIAKIKEKMSSKKPKKNKKNDNLENPDVSDGSDDDIEEIDWELERKAQAELTKATEKKMKEVEAFIQNCGITDNRPFETLKWTFDGALRAWVRDSLTYDLYASEIVPGKLGQPHHWFPVDAATIKYSSSQLSNYKDAAEQFQNIDILFPESNPQKREKVQERLKLDEEALRLDKYKWVQVVRGRIERAYTHEELKVGIRNVNTDIYNNGYGISELELLVSLVTGHLNAEFYNQAYFTQGFSAKGILHIKANISRRKIETVRQQWQHMLKGSRNSFQTPIFAGVDEVSWIPLTQNHTDIGFEGWMRYLIRMICAIYQIDPAEIGVNLKDEGGGGMSGDNTKEKIIHSKGRGLYPLMRHLENYINTNILAPSYPEFELKFCGLTGESEEELVNRLEKEVKFAKTVNEIRKELDLPPLPGVDDLILNNEYLNHYNRYSKKAQEIPDPAMGGFQQDGAPPEGEAEDPQVEEAFALLNKSKSVQSKGKKVPRIIEYYYDED